MTLSRKQGEHSEHSDVRTGLTPAFGLPVSVATLLFALSTLVGSVWLLLAALAMLGPAAAALVVRPSIGSLVVTVASASVVAVESTVAVSVRVVNSGRAVSDPAHVEITGCLESIPLDVPSLAPGEGVERTLRPLVARRGVVDEEAHLSATGVFGLVRASRRLVTRRDVVAHAQPARVVAPPASASERDLPVAASRTGFDVAGVREWRPGDSAAHLHWRSTARRGRPVVLERADPRPSELLILAVAGDQSATWEAVVSVTTGLLLDGMRHGRVLRVGWPRVGGPVPVLLRDEREVLWWSAAVVHTAPPAEAPFGAFLSTIAPGAELVVVGADVGPAWWDAAASRCARGGVRLRPWAP